MNPFDYLLAVLFFAFAMFFTVVTVQELIEPRTSPEYRDLSVPQVVIVKASCSLAGLIFAGFCAFGGIYFWRETKTRSQ